MTLYVKKTTTGRTALAGKWGVGDLRKRPQVFSGHGVYEIKLFADDEEVIVPDEPFEWPIPPDLHLAGLIEVYAAVSTVSSGDIELEIVREPAGGGGDVSMFSSNLVIASGNKNSDFTDGTVPVDLANAQVSKGDHLRCDIIDPGSGAMGLALICVFLPDRVYTVMVEGLQGAQGNPGGVTSWTGQWTTSTAYTTNQAVSNNGSSYVARVDHTSGATSEPGVGASWETDWMLLASGAAADPVPRGAKVSTTGVTVASGGFPPSGIAFTSESFDTDGFHSNSTNTSRMTIPSGMDGVYRIGGLIYWGGVSNSGARALYYKLNGSTVEGPRVSGASGNNDATTTFDLPVGPLTAGDYLEIAPYQETGVSLTGCSVSFWVEWLGAP